MGTIASSFVLLPPRDPETKGIVERRNAWFNKSLMSDRKFTSPADFRHQLGDVLGRANHRVVRKITASPVDLVERDRAAMLPLPPMALHVEWREHVRSGREYYVRLDSNDYSVNPGAIGRMVTVTADLHQARVQQARRIVAVHERVWGRGVPITDPRHVGVTKTFRADYRNRPQPTDENLTRDHADYDRVFGVTGQAS